MHQLKLEADSGEQLVLVLLLISWENRVKENQGEHALFSTLNWSPLENI